MIYEVGKAIGTQTVAISELKVEFSDLKAEHSYPKRDVDVILDKLLAL